MDTYYDVLGVASDASQNEIGDQFRELASRFHPDRHPNAPPELLSQYTTAMARVSEAYTVLKSPTRRAEYDAALRSGPPSSATSTQSSRGRYRPPKDSECGLCGYGRAAFCSFRYQRAWLIGARVHTIEANLCRCCGLAFGRTAQNRTLWTGWWGMFSFFRNLEILFTNAKFLRVAASLGQPSAPKANDYVMAPLDAPVDEGKSIWKRSGVWATAAVVAFFAVAGSSPEEPPPAYSDFNSNGAGLAPDGDGAGGASWTDGACVSVSAGWVEPANSCIGADGGIVGVVGEPDSCPLVADSYVEEGSRVYCIDIYGQ